MSEQPHHQPQLPPGPNAHPQIQPDAVPAGAVPRELQPQGGDAGKVLIIPASEEAILNLPPDQLESYVLALGALVRSYGSVWRARQDLARIHDALGLRAAGSTAAVETTAASAGSHAGPVLEGESRTGLGNAAAEGALTIGGSFPGFVPTKSAEAATSASSVDPANAPTGAYPVVTQPTAASASPAGPARPGEAPGVVDPDSPEGVRARLSAWRAGTAAGIAAEVGPVSPHATAVPAPTERPHAVPAAAEEAAEELPPFQVPSDARFSALCHVAALTGSQLARAQSLNRDNPKLYGRYVQERKAAGEDLGGVEEYDRYVADLRAKHLGISGAEQYALYVRGLEVDYATAESALRNALISASCPVRPGQRLIIPDQEITRDSGLPQRLPGSQRR